MSEFGLSVAGFKPKDFSTIKDEMQAELRKEVDPALHFGPGSVAGVMTGIVANQARQVWEALSGLYHSLQPDTASGRALDALCSLTGTYRRAGSKSRVIAELTLKKKSKAPKGSRIKTVGGDVFILLKTVSNNSDKESKHEAIFIAEDDGAKIAYNGTEAAVTTLTAGWVKATMIKTSYTGNDKEGDDKLRIRRIEELRASGLHTSDSMLAQLRGISGVQEVFLIDGDGAFEAIVRGGSQTAIALAIWRSKPLGILTKGTTQITIKDEFNQDRVIKFSRPRMIHMTLHLVINGQPDKDRLKISLLNFAHKYFKLGSEVYPSHFYATCLADPNVLDVVSLELRERGSGNRVPTQIAQSEIASLISDDIHISIEGSNNDAA